MEWYCQTCGEPIDYHEDEEGIVPVRVYIDMSEVIDYIFMELMKDGYAPESERIYDVLMHYQDFMDRKVGEAFDEANDND